MAKKTISAGAVHSVPADLRKVLIADPAAWAKWEDITPLARNEWICWVISVKKPKPEGSTLSEYARNSKKECAGLVAGQAVLTAETFPGRSSLPVKHENAALAGAGGEYGQHRHE